MTDRKQQFAELVASGLTQKEARERVKACAREQYESASTGRDWRHYLAPDELALVEAYLREQTRGIMDASNFRAARYDSPSQTRRYKRIRALGCCGFSDWIVTLGNGVRYRVGYNYGH